MIVSMGQGSSCTPAWVNSRHAIVSNDHALYNSTRTPAWKGALTAADKRANKAQMEAFKQVFNAGQALTPWQAGLTTGIFSVTAMVTSLPFVTALLVERFGRRRGIQSGGCLCLAGIVLQAAFAGRVSC